MRKVLSSKDLRALYEQAARVWAEEYIRLARTQEYVVGGWAGGRVIEAFLPFFVEALAQIPAELRNKHRIFQVDERIFSEHNSTMLERSLIEPALERGLLSSEQKCFYPLHLAQSPDHGTSAYTELLGRCGGSFSYIMLSSGLPHLRGADGGVERWDCHVAGTFAHHPSTTAEAARRPGFFYYYDSPKKPDGRVTATQPLLALSRAAFLFVVSPEKAPVLDEYLSPAVLLADCPAKIVRSIERRVLVTDAKVGWWRRFRA